MKKITALLCAAIMIMGLTSCVEQIGSTDTPSSPAAVTKPTENEPLATVNTDNVPSDAISDPTDPTNSTDPDATDPTGSQSGKTGEVTVTEIGKKNAQGITEVTSSPTGTYPRNNLYSAEGTAVDSSTSGDTITYRTKYTETLSVITEIKVTTASITVNAYAEHYRFYLAPGKPIDISIGTYSTQALSPSVKWEENGAAARSQLFSVTAPNNGDKTVNISYKMPFNGTYHGEEIKDFTFNQQITIAG